MMNANDKEGASDEGAPPSDRDSRQQSGDCLGAAPGPLQGVKVVDFCSFIAGSYGAMVLGDFGAEVIKVEPLTGDLARAWGPFVAGESRWFQGWNRNKRSLCVDLTRSEGQQIVYRLIEQADILVENYRPGITEKLKIDYATAARLNPRIIYCSSSAFGSRGPLRSRPAYDPVLQAMGGAAHGSIRVAGRVALCSVAVSDFQAAMQAVSGILAALYHREKTGVGQHLETSLLQAIMSAQSHHYCQALEREEEGPVGICPYRLFETADELIFIGAATDRFFARLCDALGASDLAADPRFQSNPLRIRHQSELYARLEPFFKTKTAAQWEELLPGKGVPCGIVSTYQQFFSHPQVEAMDMNPIVNHPTIGPIRVAGLAVHFEKTPGQIRHAAPVLGQHTDEILRECGYSGGAIESLRSKGVIGSHDRGGS